VNQSLVQIAFHYLVRKGAPVSFTTALMSKRRSTSVVRVPQGVQQSASLNAISAVSFKCLKVTVGILLPSAICTRAAAPIVPVVDRHQLVKTTLCQRESPIQVA
jgi:hypothetical protein